MFTTVSSQFQRKNKLFVWLVTCACFCAICGFRLTKFTSNRKAVLLSLPKEERARDVESLDLDYGNESVERALGVQWTVYTDMFGFSIMLSRRDLIRRGILSVVSSVYDPLGFISPFSLPAKRLLQDICQMKTLGWDNELPEEYQLKWLRWLKEVPMLNKRRIRRCLTPEDFGPAVSSMIHAFPDASKTVYGVSAYIRKQNQNGDIHCALLMVKSRVAPIKATTIPRLELTAATLPLKIGLNLKSELERTPDEIVYHTDCAALYKQ